MTNTPARRGKPTHSTGADRISVLTQTQQRFLQTFFETQTSEEPFYLSGGTALAGYYLEHRYSDDLDFFTRDRGSLEPAFHRERVERAAAAAGVSFQGPERRGDHVRYVISGDNDAEHPLLKVELVLDTPPYFGSPRNFSGVFVDDLLAIAVNKVTALGREEPKDYVDLYQIIQSGRYRLEELIPLAIEKNPGVDALTLAADFRRVTRLPDPSGFQGKYMRVPLDWNAIMRFYQEWAGKLFALFPPRRQE